MLIAELPDQPIWLVARFSRMSRDGDIGKCAPSDFACSCR